ncbi:hypothetical protein LEP1GSC051_1030 [Leptospira sp. P2653]|nr:hypothetical protein LEP1GSC051_1030 [Leptospira sp. P2653]
MITDRKSTDKNKNTVGTPTQIQLPRIPRRFRLLRRDYL